VTPSYTKVQISRAFGQCGSIFATKTLQKAYFLKSKMAFQKSGLLEPNYKAAMVHEGYAMTSGVS
jgi:hypothetical protein